MANDVLANPLILDTAGDKLVSADIRITKIRLVWDAAPAGGDTATLEDNATGRVIWESILAAITGAGAILPDESSFNPPLRASGLNVGTITAGLKLYVYHDGPNPLKTT